VPTFFVDHALLDEARRSSADASIKDKYQMPEKMAGEYRLPLIRMIEGSGGGGSVPGSFSCSTASKGIRTRATWTRASSSTFQNEGASPLLQPSVSDGAASSYLHRKLAVGDLLEAGAPRGSFVLGTGQRPVVLVSAGVGATPVLAMLHVLEAQRSTRQVWWLHGARNRTEHAFRDEAGKLLESLDGAHRVVCYSNPGPDDRVGRDFDVAARLTGSVIENVGVPIDAEFYICGPGQFMLDIAAALAARGITPDCVKSEIFGPSDAVTPGVVGGTPTREPHPPEENPATGPSVSFSRSNLTVAWDPTFGTLLEFAEACDVPVRWACRTGVCHTCETGLVGGAVAYQPQPLEPPEAGNALICCARPDGELVLDL